MRTFGLGEILRLLPLLLLPIPANAFEYWEHRSVTDDAVQALCSEEPDRPLCAGVRAWTSAVGDKNTTGVPPISLGDLTGLAGDHSIHPHGLLQRLYGHTPFKKIGLLTSARAKAPEQVQQPGMKVVEFLKEANRDFYSKPAPDPDWRLCASEKKSVWDVAVQNWDGAYVANAAQNVSHFRFPGGVSDEQLWARRQQNTAGFPTLHAVSYYADMHSGALVHMRAAGQAQSESQRERHFRSAVVLESFALHFLQDGVAAGHLGGTNGHLGHRGGRFLNGDVRLAGDSWLNIGTGLRRRKFHNPRSQCGTAVQLTPSAMAALDTHVGEVIIYGDGIVGCAKESLTERLLVAATQASLLELDRAFVDAELSVIQPTAPSVCALSGPEAIAGELAGNYADLCAHWSEPVVDRGGERVQRIKAMWLSGYFAAVDVLPLVESPTVLRDRKEVRRDWRQIKQASKAASKRGVEPPACE